MIFALIAAVALYFAASAMLGGLLLVLFVITSVGNGWRATARPRALPAGTAAPVVPLSRTLCDFLPRRLFGLNLRIGDDPNEDRQSSGNGTLPARRSIDKDRGGPSNSMPKVRARCCSSGLSQREYAPFRSLNARKLCSIFPAGLKATSNLPAPSPLNANVCGVWRGIRTESPGASDQRSLPTFTTYSPSST